MKKIEIGTHEALSKRDELDLGHGTAGKSTVNTTRSNIKHDPYVATQYRCASNYVVAYCYFTAPQC